MYQALTLAQKLYTEGEKDAQVIRRQMADLIQQQPLADIDYISIADAETLDELDVVRPPNNSDLIPQNKARLKKPF